METYDTVLCYIYLMNKILLRYSAYILNTYKYFYKVIFLMSFFFKIYLYIIFISIFENSFLLKVEFFILLLQNSREKILEVIYSFTILPIKPIQTSKPWPLGYKVHNFGLGSLLLLTTKWIQMSGYNKYRFVEHIFCLDINLYGENIQIRFFFMSLE